MKKTASWQTNLDNSNDWLSVLRLLNDSVNKGVSLLANDESVTFGKRAKVSFSLFQPIDLEEKQKVVRTLQERLDQLYTQLAADNTRLQHMM